MERQDDKHSDNFATNQNCTELQQSLQKTITQGQSNVAILRTTDNKCQHVPQEIYQQSQTLSRLIDTTYETDEKAPIILFSYDSKILAITLEYLTIPQKHTFNNTFSNRQNFNQV